MTGPSRYAVDTDAYERNYGDNSPVAQQEWQQFLQRRKELLDLMMTSSHELVSGMTQGQQPTQSDPTLGMATQGIMPADSHAREDENHRDLLARAEFWRVPNADQMSIEQLQAAIGARRAEQKSAPETTIGSVGRAFGGATEQMVSTAARLTGNLVENVVGQAPFIGETLRSMLATDRAKNWLYNWSSKLDESSQMLQAQQPEHDKTAGQFLTAAGKTAGYVLPAFAAWEGIGAAGAAVSVPGWLGWASTPLTRLALRGALSGAVLDDPLATPGEKAVNFGLGAILGASQGLGFFGLGLGGAALGAGVGGGVGNTPEEQRRNQIIGGIGGFALGGLVPMAAQSFLKVRAGIPSAFDQKLGEAIRLTDGEAIPADQSGGLRPPGEEMAEVLNNSKQVSGNPVPQKYLPGGQPQAGDITSAEELSALMRSEPTRSLGEGGQLQQGIEPPKTAGLLPVSTEESGALQSLESAVDNTLTELQHGAPTRPLTERLAQRQRAADLQRYNEQQAELVANRALASVTQGPSHILGSKVADAQGRPLRVYHGTGVEFEKFNPESLDPDVLFGPGFYHTESPEIAAGYAGPTPDQAATIASYQQQLSTNDMMMQQAVGNPQQLSALQAQRAMIQGMMDQTMARSPNIRPAFLDIKNPFDIDQKFSAPEATKFIEEIIAVYDAPGSVARDLEIPDMRRIIDFVNSEPEPQPGEELYSRLIDALGGKQAVNEALELAGYDGITHIGGARTGNDPHRVWVAFKPEQIHMPWRVEPLGTQDAINTAQAISKQATVLESSTMPDAMSKPQVGEVDAVEAAKASNPGGVSVLRNIGRPLDLLAQHPDVYFAQREGKLDALIGEVTPEMVQDYERHGVYEGQVVLTQKGIEGTVLNVNGRGLVTLARRGGGPPLRVKASNLLPSRFGDPVRQAPDLWDSFKADLLGYMNDEAQKASMAPVRDLFDPRVGDVMQSRLEDYLDRRGINDQADRQAIDAYMNQRFVEEAKNLDPESRDLQAKITDMAVAAENEGADDLVVSTEEKAAAKGFIWLKEPGQAGGILRDNLNPESALEIPIASESDVGEFLKNVDRAALELTPTGSSVPPEVMENVPTDTTLEPAGGIDTTVDAAADASWRKFAVDSVPIREFGQRYGSAIRDNFADTTQRINDILDQTAAERQAAQAARVGGGGSGGGRLPPQDVGGEGFDPWPRRLPGEEGNETLGAQFERLERDDLPAYERIRDKYSNNLFRYTRYLMAGLERSLTDAGLSMGRAWKHYEAMETARIHADNEAYPWLKEYGEVMKEFPREILRDGTVTRIHEIEDTNARMAEWYRLTDRGFSKEDIRGFIDSDVKISDFNHRWFEFLSGDPAFGLTADREIFRYMAHVRARQAAGAKNPYDSKGWLSPNSEYFAEFAREGNLQFRVMDPRELGNYMVRAGMFKKWQAGPWDDFVSTWQDPRVPEPIRNLMMDHARAMRYGYDARGDIMVKTVKFALDKMLGLKVTDREAGQIIAAPVSGMYMSMLAGRASIFFRDAVQPLLALAKVRTNFMRGVYTDVLKGTANRQVLEGLYQRGLEGGWITHDVPPIEGLGVFEEPAALRRNELLGLTPDQVARRELFASIGDRVQELPAWLARPTESNLSTLKWYGKQQQLQRAIVGEAAFRQAETHLSEYRAAEMTAALARDPSMAVPYKEFAKRSFFSSFDTPIATRLQELVDAGQDKEAAMMFAREVTNWSQFKYGRREQPGLVRSNFGRVMSAFGNFSGQFLEGGIDAAIRSGEPMHKARYLAVVGAVSGLLSYAGAKTGWSFGKWAWTGALKYAGGPGLDYAAQLAAAAGGAAALSDNRRPSPFQNDALRATVEGSVLPNPMSFFPYAGYLRSAAEYSAASQGLHPIEQAARYTITGDRGSRIDVLREDQQRNEEFVRLLEQRSLQQGGLPTGTLHQSAAPAAPAPGNHNVQVQPGQPRTLQQQYLQGIGKPGHPGNGAIP